MYILNLTRGEKRENLILRSLKAKPEAEDLTIAPGEVLDTEMECIPNRKVMESRELKVLEKDGKIKISADDPRDALTPEQKEKAVTLDKKQQLLDEISVNSVLTWLKDLMDSSDDIDVIRAAANRRDDLIGSEGPDTPSDEAGGSSNPIIS